MSFDGSLKFDTKIDESGFKKGLATLQASGKSIIDGFVKATKIATVALSGLGLASIKVGSDFEAGMSEVKAISGATGEEFELLKAKAKEMGATTKFSATEASEGLKYMAMAGWDTQQMLDALPGVMNLAAASGEELGAVSDIVTDALTAFGMEASQAGEFADLLASASSNSNTNVGMMGETFKYVAPLAGALGYSAEDTALAIGILADNGIKGSQAGTMLRAMFTRLVKPTKESAQAMDDLGIVMTDAAGNMKPLDQVLQEMRKSFGGLTEEQQAQYAAALAGQQGMSGLLAIMNTSEEDFQKLTKATTEYTGAAEEMSKIMQDNLQGDITLLKSALEGLGIALYENMGEGLRAVVQYLNEFVDAIAIALQGPEAFAKSMEGLQTEFGQLAGSAGGVEEAMQGVRFGIEGVAESISEILVNALVGLGEIIPDMVETGRTIILAIIEGIRESMPQVSEAILNIAEAMITNFIVLVPEFLSLGIELVTNLLQGFQERLPDLISLGQESITNLLDAIVDNAPQMLSAGIEIVAALLQGLAESLPEIITGGIDLVIGLADAIIDNIDTVFDTGIEIIKAIVQGLMDNLPKLIQEAPRIINEFADGIYNNLPKILKTGIEIIVMIAKGLIQAIPTLIANIPEIIRAIVNAFILYDWLNLGKTLIENIGSGIKSMAGNIGSIAKNIAKGVIDGFKNLFKQGPNIGKNLIQLIGQGFNALKGGLINIAKGIGTGVINGIKAIFKGGIEIGKFLVQGIWKGIANAKDWLLGKIKGFATSITDGIKGFFGIKSPSKVLQDEVGVWLPRGIAEGIRETTPELRAVNDREMSKLVADYRKYGEEAIKGYGELSKAELDKLKKEHKKDGKALTEAIAKGMEEKTHRVKEAMDKIRDATLGELNRLGDGIMTALENQYKEQEELQLAAIDENIKRLKEASEEKIKIWENELKEEKSKKKDGSDAIKQILEEKIKAEKEAMKDTEKLKKEEEDRIKEHYSKLLDSQNLMQEARRLALQEDQTELVSLLDSYNPSWQDQGQSFGESLLYGLNSMQKPISQEVSEILGMASQAEMANTRILEAKKDWEMARRRGDKEAMAEAHARAERYRKQGGDLSKDVGVHIAKSLGDGIKLGSSDINKITDNQLKQITDNYKKQGEMAVKGYSDSAKEQMQIYNNEMEENKKQSEEKIAQWEKELAERKVVLNEDSIARAEQLEEMIENEKQRVIEKDKQLKKEMDSMKKQYAELNKTERENAAIRKSEMKKNNDELVAMLESYKPQWYAQGKGLGEAFLDGLSDVKNDIQNTIAEIGEMMSEAQSLSIDTSYLENGYKDSQDSFRTINNSNTTNYTGGTNNTVNQEITIVSPSNTPSENARLLKRKQEEILRGY